MTRHSIAGAMLILAMVVPAIARGQVRLEFKYPDGDKSTTIKRIKSEQVLTVAGMETKTGSEQTITTVLQNGRRAADGTLPVRHTVASLVAEVRLPGGIEVEYDSAKENDSSNSQFAAVLQVLNAMSKSDWTAIHGQDNRITTIKPQDDALAGVDAGTRELIKRQFDPEYLKVQANNLINRIPTTPVQVGDSWERTETLRLEGGQNMTFKIRYEYQGAVNRGGRNLDKIDSRTLTVDYNVDPNGPLRIVNSDLKIAESSGTIYFDRQRGEMAGTQERVRIRGQLTFDVNGMQIPGNLDLTMSRQMVVRR